MLLSIEENMTNQTDKYMISDDEFINFILEQVFNNSEKLKLSYLVRQIDYDTGIIPEGYYKLIDNAKHYIYIRRDSYL